MGTWRQWLCNVDWLIIAINFLYCKQECTAPFSFTCMLISHVLVFSTVPITFFYCMSFFLSFSFFLSLFLNFCEKFNKCSSVLRFLCFYRKLCRNFIYLWIRDYPFLLPCSKCFTFWSFLYNCNFSEHSGFVITPAVISNELCVFPHSVLWVSSASDSKHHFFFLMELNHLSYSVFTMR